MKIEKLTLRNFRNHESLAIEPAKNTFVLGENATGKSSIAAAIQFLLTGKCQLLSDGGHDAESLVRIGAKELTIEADISLTGKMQPNHFTRTKSARSHNFSINGSPRDVRMAQDGIEKILGVSTEAISCCLNSSRFVGLGEKDQKQFLSAILASESITVPAEILNACREVDREAFAVWTGEIDSVSTVDAGYKRFFDLRTDAKRDLKNLGTMEAPELFEPGETGDIKQQIEALRTEKFNLEKRIAVAESGYRAQQNFHDQQESSLKRRIAVAESSLLVSKVADDFERIAANLDKIAEADAKVASFDKAISERRRAIRSEWERVIAGYNFEIDSKTAQIEALANVREAECPTCKRPFTKKDKEQITSLGIQLDGEVTQLRERLKATTDTLFAGGNQAQRDEINSLIEKHGKAQTKRQELGDPAAAERQLRGHREALIEISKCERELKELKKPVISDLTATIDGESTSLDDHIATLTGRIAKGESVLEEARQKEQQRIACDNWARKKIELEVRIETLNRLVEYFGPNGIKTKLVGDKVGPFTDAMNEVLQGFGYCCAFTMEPYQFTVTGVNGDDNSDRRLQTLSQPRSLKQLSESEQWRFGCAFSIALAKTTGINFVILDRADCLDSESRSALMEMIGSSRLDQAIVLATSDGDIPEAQEGELFIRLGETKAVAA